MGEERAEKKGQERRTEQRWEEQEKEREREREVKVEKSRVHVASSSVTQVGHNCGEDYCMR